MVERVTECTIVKMFFIIVSSGEFAGNLKVSVESLLILQYLVNRGEYDALAGFSFLNLVFRFWIIRLKSGLSFSVSYLEYDTFLKFLITCFSAPGTKMYEDIDILYLLAGFSVLYITQY
jgi:hypothetical protein